MTCLAVTYAHVLTPIGHATTATARYENRLAFTGLVFVRLAASLTSPTVLTLPPAVDGLFAQCGMVVRSVRGSSCVDGGLLRCVGHRDVRPLVCKVRYYLPTSSCCFACVTSELRLQFCCVLPLLGNPTHVLPAQGYRVGRHSYVSARADTDRPRRCRCCGRGVGGHPNGRQSGRVRSQLHVPPSAATLRALLA